MCVEGICFIMENLVYQDQKLDWYHKMVMPMMSYSEEGGLDESEEVEGEIPVFSGVLKPM